MTHFSPADIRIPNGHFISGQLRSGEGVLPVLRPSDGAEYARLADASDDIVDEAVTRAYQAFTHSNWATQPPRDRARILRRWAELIEQDINYLAPLESLGSTRPITQSRAWDVPYTADGIRFFAELADKCGGEVAATATQNLGMQIAEPLGVVGAIAPWNFPLSMACWKVGAALAAGNAVVLKPSEMTPFSSVRLAQLAIKAGVPEGIFNVIQGSGAQAGATLCVHPLVSKMTFTGSTATGQIIMQACAMSGPKPVTLELGGKSPQVVFGDVSNIERVAQTVAGAITGNAGQVCVAGSRLIVHRSLEDQMVALLQSHFSLLTPGLTWDDTSRFSPIISDRQCERIESIVTRAIEAGAECLCGGERFDTSLGGAFYRPTILKVTDRHNPAVQEEIFGPVITVQTFEDDDEALSLAEHEVYGLASGVYTSNLGRAMTAVRRMKAGSVWVNRYGRSDDHILPTGGYKRSGIGRDLGRAAFESNLHHKSVLIDIEASL